MSAKPGVPQASHRTNLRRGDMSWQEHAACADYSSRIFFDPARAEEAKSVCRGCAVKTQCAKLRGQAEGVWGGRAHYPGKAGRPKR